MTVSTQTERLAEVVPEALAAIHEVLERHRVTEDEWMAVLAFLTEVGRADEFILLSASLRSGRRSTRSTRGWGTTIPCSCAAP